VTVTGNLLSMPETHSVSDILLPVSACICDDFGFQLCFFGSIVGFLIII